MATENIHVETRAIHKRYRGTHALRGVSLTLQRGEVHCVVGENGAGKSTLGKILGGAVPHDAGQLVVNGRAVHYGSAREALLDGVARVGQEPALVPYLTVLENVFLGIESSRAGFVRSHRLIQRYDEVCEIAGLRVEPHARVHSLRLADQQRVEILRALARQADLVVMDEPTAGQGRTEVTALLDLLNRLRENGTTIVFVSHSLNEALAIGDRITIMRDGEIVRTASTRAETAEGIALAMIGRKIDATFPPRSQPAAKDREVLSVAGLSLFGTTHRVSLSVSQGEIVGLAGLADSGRTEIARAIAGIEHAEGKVRIDGRRIRLRSPRDAKRHGIALVPASRVTEGLVMIRSLAENITLPHLDPVSRLGWIRRRREAAEVNEVMRRVEIRASSERVPVSELSGGNQQKAVIGKWLRTGPRLLIAEEPTRGVDVGAREAIYRLLLGLADGGMGIILISSDLPELLGLADRIVVLRGGEVVAEVQREDATAEEIMKAMLGTSLEADDRS